jgi:hypothetical protein
MGAGLVIGGIILVIIGIGALSFLGSLKGTAEQGSAQSLGQAGQLLSPDLQQKCQQVQLYVPAIQAGYYTGIAFVPLGFVMAIIGAVTRRINKEKTKKGRMPLHDYQTG